MIIDGNKLAAKIEAGLVIPQPPPTLGIVVLPDDRAGRVYTRLKQAAAQKLGIKVVTADSAAILDSWARDKEINGILIQYPGWRGGEFAQTWRRWVAKIPPQKDVDGLRSDSPFVPATVRAVEKILAAVKIPLQSRILVVGRGMIGQALAKKFSAESLGSHELNLAGRCLQAEVLISACGRPGIIKAVKPGAVVIDCGWPKGDADFDAVKKIAGAITPVPGGVGPVTVACLLENLLLTV